MSFAYLGKRQFKTTATTIANRENTNSKTENFFVAVAIAVRGCGNDFCRLSKLPARATKTADRDHDREFKQLVPEYSFHIGELVF